MLHVSTPQSMILQSYQNKLIWESESTAAQICQIWNTTPEADVHVIKTFSFLSRNGSKDTEYSCSLIPVSNTSLMQRVVTDMILQNSPEYPVKHYSAFQGDSGDVCGSVLRHFLGTDGEILFPGWSLDLSVKLTLDTFVFHILVAKSWRCRLQASRSAVTIYKATLCSAWGSWPNLTASRRNLLLPPRKTDHALRCYQCLNLEACQSGGASFV